MRSFKVWLVLSFLVVLGVLYLFFDLELVLRNEVFLGQDIPQDAPNLALYENDTVLPQTRLRCDDTHTIEYLYYENKSENEIKNNKFGLYTYAENKDFIELAADLVNSNGGDWGYVLIPYNVKDRDFTKWREAFDLLYETHLIPIIQLHDVDLDDYEEQTQSAAEFLDSFVWPIKQRYVSVYNEPNDDKFWYGSANAKQYAEILDYTVETFKNQNVDFFMLNGAFNVSAGGGANGYIDAFDFMFQMNSAVPGIFDKLDGWASHSYPQPNFSGSPFGVGRMSIKAYESEITYLKNTLGVQKDLPVFITETGWAHAQGENYDGSYFDADQVAENFRIAFENVWLPDERVVAVTPFTVWYEAPFDHFSWVNNDKVPYKQFEVVKSLQKIEGTPNKLVSASVSAPECENQL